MAVNRKKRPVEIPDPSASSSEAEDSSSSSEEEEEQQDPPPTVKPRQQQEEDVDDEDDDDDEEEEESDDPEKAVDATVTPSNKNPQSESEGEDEEESDSEDDGKAIKLSSVSDFTVKNKSTEPTKRALENAGTSKNNKKAKVASDGDGKIAVSAVDDSKKSVVNRVWSENDEILLLEEFHAFITKNGSDSITNISGFYDTLEDLDLSLKVTKTRLYDKLRGLKNKYLNNVRREQSVFSKPHEEKLYKISAKIWGGEVGVIEGSRSKSTRNKKAAKKSLEKDICKMDEAGSSFPRLAASLEFEASTYLQSIDSKGFAKNMVPKFNKKKAKELEDKWKEYSLMEYELYAKRLKIMSKQADETLNLLKHSNH